MVLLLFMGHYGNITLFYHTHTIDGITYAHSHFYGFGKSADPVQLPHTNNQLQLIQELNQITWHSAISIATVETPVFHLLNEFRCTELQQDSLQALPFASLRAPPSVVA
ncbi:MAG: hypothetical protein LWW91_07325 [Bacteroidales bacterium]|nr:hypothetical protein [Bacteroidales bacterium]